VVVVGEPAFVAFGAAGDEGKLLGANGREFRSATTVA
jgi:hypothetical protein